MSTALALVPERPQTALIRPVVEPQAVLEIHHAIAKLVAETLKEGVDYGIIPGTKKPSLYKSGAERLCVGFGLVDRYEIIEKEVDHNFESAWEKRDKRGEVYASGTAKGLYRYVVKCYLYRREDDVLVAEGVGSCSSLESKYCDRPRDCENTILKMAKKRAKIDATLTGLGLSDRFTQDVEDMEHPIEDEEGRPAQRPRGQEVRKAERPSREKVFPFKGPFQGKPIGEMPLDAIRGYVDWIRKKQTEKNDETFCADLLAALTEVAAEKKAEAERNQTTLDLDAEEAAIEADLKAHITPKPAASPASSSAPATGREEKIARLRELLRHPVCAGIAAAVERDLDQQQLSDHQLEEQIRVAESMIAAAGKKGAEAKRRQKQPVTLGATLPGEEVEEWFPETQKPRTGIPD